MDKMTRNISRDAHLISYDWLAVIKGILIILVVVDHNEYLRKIGSYLFLPLNIHVVGFFVIAYMATIKNKEDVFCFISKRFKRYGLAYFWFYAIYSVLSIAVGKIGPVNLYWFFDVWFLGLVNGSFHAVKNGCGAAFMWFLPALFGFVTLVKLSVVSRVFKLILCLFSLLFYLAPFFYIDGYLVELPFGVGLSIYLFLVIYLARLFYKNYLLSIKIGFKFYVLLAVVIVATHMVLVAGGRVVELGELVVPSIKIPIDFAAIMIGVMATYFFISKIEDNVIYDSFLLKFIAYVGNKSIAVFLLHQIFLHIFYRFFEFVKADLIFNLFLGLGSGVFAVCSSLISLKIYNFFFQVVAHRLSFINYK